MKLRQTLLVAFSALSLGCIAANDSIPEVQMTLDDCLRIALTENPTVRIANMEVQRVDYAHSELLGQLLPQASFTGTYNRTLAKQVMYMNMDGFPGLGGGSSAEGDESGEAPASRAGGNSGGGIKVGLDNSYQVGFSASVPIIAPQLWASLKLSDSQILQALEQARSSKLELVRQVKVAYYSLQLATDSKRVVSDSYDMASLTYQIYSSKYEAGAASDYDVLRASVAMRNIEPQLLQADIAVKQARLQLLLLMGLETGSVQIAPVGDLADYEGKVPEYLLALNSDYANNSQLILSDIQTRQLEQAIKVQKASLLPTLSLSGNYNWTSMSNGSPFQNFRWTPYSMVGITFNWPLFMGGQRYNRIKQAQVQLDEMHWQRDYLENSVQMQVDLAIDNIRLNAEQISSQALSMQQAERAHSIMEQSFQLGAASYLDLRDSELALTQSRLAYVQTVYNFMIAQAELELLQGNAKIDY